MLLSVIAVGCKSSSDDPEAAAGTTGGGGTAAGAGTGGIGGTTVAGTGGTTAGTGGTTVAGTGGTTAGTGGTTAGTGGTTAGTGGTGGGMPPSIDEFVCPGGTIVEGWTTIMVGDRARRFYTEFPSNMSGPVGLIFSWHGYNDGGADGDAAGWRNNDEVDANADPEFPVIVVTPDDTDIDFALIGVSTGLDWQLDKGTAAENIDLAFFEAMVGCYNEQFDINPAQIYSYGFSAGSVMTALVHSAYPNIVSAAVCVSGMWFNDQAEVDQVMVLTVDPSWPVLHPEDKGTILLTHGGSGDVVTANAANIENMAQSAFPFLKAANRVVVDCAHEEGHTLHPDLTTEHVMRFFKEHPAGTDSAYRSGAAFTGYPGNCMLRLPD